MTTYRRLTLFSAFNGFLGASGILLTYFLVFGCDRIGQNFACNFGNPAFALIAGIAFLALIGTIAIYIVNPDKRNATIKILTTLAYIALAWFLFGAVIPKLM